MLRNAANISFLKRWPRVVPDAPPAWRSPNPFCRQQQVQAYQYTVNQYNDAERRRIQACN
ncbi:MAG: hypothetical protein H7326_06220 [Bdellovibrionaceae bacterium]|nr:hypothetical protein [Pseudobdellovibrionaceae bacterium]